MKIQIIAPSACLDQTQILQASAQLTQMGIDIDFTSEIFTSLRYLAGNALLRVNDLKQACHNPNIDAIWCGRGGTGAAQLVPELDDWLLSKPIIGYSDTTVLLNAVAMRGGQALHGPVLQEISSKNLFGSEHISADARTVLDMLYHPQRIVDYPVHRYQADTVSNPHLNDGLEPIKGKILGGNLATLSSLQGTAGALQLNEPSILLIEDVGEPYYRLERMWVQLMQSIDTSQLKAVILGDFVDCPQKNVSQSIASIFDEYLQPLGILLYTCDWFGHGAKNRPFWIGRQGTLLQNTLSI